MRDWVIFGLILVLSSIGHISTDIYLPSMPYLVQYFETSASTIQLTFTAYLLSYCIAPLIVGPLSDRIGRKRPILMGIYISLASTLLCIFAHNAYLLIIARFFQGIGMGIIVSTSRAILPDYFQGQKLAQYFSYMSMGMSLMIAIAPPVGGMIQEISSWRMIFFSIFIYLFMILFLVKFILKETAKEDSKSLTSISQNQLSSLQTTLNIYYESYKILLQNKSFMLYSFCNILAVMGVISYLTTSPFIFQEIIGLSPTEYGLTAVVVCMTIFTFGLINSRIVQKIKPRTLLYSNCIFIMLAGVLFCLFQNLNLINTYTILIPVIIYFSTMPSTFSNASTLALKNLSENYGSATALSMNLQFLGGMLGSAIISFAELSLLPLGILYICISLVYTSVLFLAGKQNVAEKLPSSAV